MLFLAACGTRLDNQNWPGLAVDGSTVYVAYGSGILAYDVAAQTQVWSFPDEPSASVSFFAAPSISDERIVFGDYGAIGFSLVGMSIPNSG